MDGFSYNNIFETKGIEYLIIIAFLAMIIPFWIIINRQAGITRQIKRAIGVLSASILRIPQGLFYSKNHTWTHLEKSGTAKVGLDDLLLHITGEVKFINLKNPGNFINKGELLAEIDQNGKLLQIYSPLSGRIMNTNTMLYESPGVINEDPYGKGWIYKIKPSEWIAETDSYYLADEAIAWSKKELERFKDFLEISMNKYSPEVSMVILQDGGELCDRPLSKLPDEVWQDFQESFLN
ncbi:MAG: glycine cleavage system protein H [Bacteroidota bacterium]